MPIRPLTLLLLVAGLLTAAQVGLEPVTITASDGSVQTYFRINTGAGAIDQFPAGPESPATGGDTGLLWVDRNHRDAICASIALSGDGRHVLANWYLNNQRAGYYRVLATEVPIWESPGDFPWAYGGQQAGASSDGGVLALSLADRCLSWSRNSPVPVWDYHYPTAYTGFARCSHDGSTVVAAQNGTLYGFHAATGDTLWTTPISEPTRLQGISLSDDGSVVAVTLYDSCLVFEDGIRRAGIPIGTSSSGTQYAVPLSGDGSLLATGDYQGRLRLFRWNGSSYDLRWTAQVGTPWVAGLGISRDGSTIACGTGYNDGKLCVFDSSSATPLWVYQGYGSQGAYVPSVALSADGSRIAAASWGDRATSGEFKVFTVHDRSDTTPLVGVTRNQELGSLFCCAISDDGQFAVAGGKAVHAQVMGRGGEVYAAIVGETPSANAGVSRIIAPTRFLQVSSPVSPVAEVSNYGDDSAGFAVHCRIINSDDSTVWWDSAQVTVPAGRADTASFGSWTPDTYDAYDLQFYTALAGDLYPGDDSLILRAKCFHDGRPTLINPPGFENTIRQLLTPRAVIHNNGSYSEAIACAFAVLDSAGTIIYADSTTTSTLGPDLSQTVSFTPWAPPYVGSYTAVASATAPEDFYPGNDTLDKHFVGSYEIIYDDGGWNSFYWVGRQDNDKFYVRFTPTLSPPFALTHGRVYVNMANTPFDYVMVCPGSGSKPDTVAPYQTVTNVTAPQAPGWAEFDLDVTVSDSGDVWLICHWPPGSPAMGVGADVNPPIDLRSYLSSNQDTFRLWTTHDWMMRLTQSPEVGLAGEVGLEPGLSLRLDEPAPNPFAERVWLEYEVPTPGHVRLDLFDAAGRLVTRLADGLHVAGHHRKVWCNSEARLGNGIYYARLLLPATGESRTRKLVLSR